MPKLSNDEIDHIERDLGLHLPAIYRKLLLEIGFGDVGPNAEVYLPSAIRELYEPFFDDPSELFSRYFPFGCNNQKQEIWIVDVPNQRAASIWHETVPDDDGWAAENWLSFRPMDQARSAARAGEDNLAEVVLNG